MNSYAYCIMGQGKKLVGGSTHANSMDEAGRDVLRRNGVIVLSYLDYAPPMYRFKKDGKWVSVAIWLSPELFTELKEPE